MLKCRGVKKFLGVPEIPVAQPTSAPQPAFSAFSALKLPTMVKQEPTAVPSESVKLPTAVPSDSVKLPDRRISPSSNISQRLRSLEKQVKGRKKNKKR